MRPGPDLLGSTRPITRWAKLLLLLPPRRLLAIRPHLRPLLLTLRPLQPAVLRKRPLTPPVLRGLLTLAVLRSPLLAPPVLRPRLPMLRGRLPGVPVRRRVPLAPLVPRLLGLPVLRCAPLVLRLLGLVVLRGRWIGLWVRSAWL